MGRQKTFQKKDMKLLDDVLEEPLRSETQDVPEQDVPNSDVVEQVSSINSKNTEKQPKEEDDELDEGIAKMFGDVTLKKKQPIEIETVESEVLPASAKPATSSGIDFKRKKKNKVVNETVVFPTWLDEAFKGVRLDSKGKVIEGSRGILSQIARNGVIKELFELGVLDESYVSRLEPYD